jgi:hypothetical protein
MTDIALCASLSIVLPFSFEINSMHTSYIVTVFSASINRAKNNSIGFGTECASIPSCFPNMECMRSLDGPPYDICRKNTFYCGNRM